MHLVLFSLLVFRAINPSLSFVLRNDDFCTPNVVVRDRSVLVPFQTTLPAIASSASEQGAQEEGEDVYQRDDRNDDIVTNIVQYFRNATVHDGGERKRGNVQLPPGWGKTQLALETLATLARSPALHNEEDSEGGVPRENRRERDGGDDIPAVRLALYVTPYLKLVDQVLDHLDRFGTLAGIPHTTFIVASQTSRKNQTCSTAVEDIAHFLAPRRRNPSHKKNKKEQGSEPLRLLISTYDSLPKVGEALQALHLSSHQQENEKKNSRERSTTIGFGIFDEAHVMEGRGERSGYGLDDALLPIDARLFLTATPRRYTESPEEVGVVGTKLRADGARSIMGQKIKEKNKKKPPVRSFVDQSLFGPCIERRTQRESVDQNVTLPLTLLALDKKEMFSLLEYVDDDEDTLLSKDALVAFAVQAAFRKVNVSRAVSFHSMNYRARDFIARAKDILSNDGIHACNVDGTMSVDKREQIMQDAKQAPKSIISNCRVLATGVDEAEWDMVVMADPVPSPVLARQMIGRVTRKSPGKERGYVLVPMMIEEENPDDDEHNNEDDQKLDATTFEGYAIFVSAFDAMVGLDPELRQDVLFVRDETNRLGKPLRMDEFPVRIRESFMLPSTMSLVSRNALMNRAITEYTGRNNWETMFALLEAYYQREGNCHVPNNHKEQERNLGTWLSVQRQVKKKGNLGYSYTKKLETLGVVWNIIENRWEDMFALLVRFQHREESCNVPRSHQEEGRNLGTWLDSQRELKKKQALDHTAQQRLEELGVVWIILEHQWEEMFALLVQFEEREGNCQVHYSHQEEGKNLGYWLRAQRQLKKKETLDDHAQQRLEELGVVWNLLEHKWEEMFALLVQFQHREGSCQVPQRHKEEGKNLGFWLNRQRVLKKKGNINTMHQGRLEQLGMVWNLK